MSLELCCLRLNADGESTGEPFWVNVAPDSTVIDLAQKVAAECGIGVSLHLLTLWKPNRTLLIQQSDLKEKVAALFTGSEHSSETCTDIVEIDPLANTEEYYRGEQSKGEIHILAQLFPNPLRANKTESPAEEAKHGQSHSSAPQTRIGAVEWEPLLTTTIYRGDSLNTLDESVFFLNHIDYRNAGVHKYFGVPPYFTAFRAELSKKRIVEPAMFERLKQRIQPVRFEDMRRDTPYAYKFFEVQSNTDTSGRGHVSQAEYQHYMLILSSDIMTDRHAFKESKLGHFYGLVYGLKQHLKSSEGKFVCDGYWDFPLAITFHKRSSRRIYQPKNTADIRFKGISHVIINVTSDHLESDRYRMLLQAACLVRFGNKLRKDGADPFVVSAIYIDQSMFAHWHYVFEGQDGKVTIMQDFFDLGMTTHAFEFMFQLYNAACYATTDSENFSHTVAPVAIGEAIQILEEKGYKTMVDFPFRVSDGLRLWSAGYRLELESESESGFRFEPPCLPTPLIRAWTGDEERVVVKYTPSSRRELKIFQHLSAFHPDDYHIIPLLEHVTLNDGPALIFPELRPLPDIVELCSSAQLRSLCMQFLWGVAFLHDHQVAHLDLKPDNILTAGPRITIQLYIHDMDLAKIVEDEDTMISDWRGTKGWIPPEEFEDAEFSPIRADRWATGKVIFYLLEHGTEPTAYEMLLGKFARRLMHPVPEKRPSVRDVSDQYYAKISLPKK